jgi:hypothetical protein
LAAVANKTTTAVAFLTNADATTGADLDAAGFYGQVVTRSMA